MANFIKLTQINETPVLVNAELIRMIQPHDNCSLIQFEGVEVLLVKEEPERIIRIMHTVLIH